MTNSLNKGNNRSSAKKNIIIPRTQAALSHIATESQTSSSLVGEVNSYTNNWRTNAMTCQKSRNPNMVKKQHVPGYMATPSQRAKTPVLDIINNISTVVKNGHFSSEWNAKNRYFRSKNDQIGLFLSVFLGFLPPKTPGVKKA